MSDRIKNILQEPAVPESLKPENIAGLIEKSGARRKKIKVVIPVVSAAAAVCLVFSVILLQNRNEFNETAVGDSTDMNVISDIKKAADEYVPSAENGEEWNADDADDAVRGNLLSGISADAGFSVQIKELHDFGTTLCKIAEGEHDGKNGTAVLVYLLSAADELSDKIVIDGQFVKTEKEGNTLTVVYVSDDDLTEKKMVLDIEDGKITVEK